MRVGKTDELLMDAVEINYLHVDNDWHAKIVDL